MSETATRSPEQGLGRPDHRRERKASINAREDGNATFAAIAEGEPFQEAAHGHHEQEDLQRRRAAMRTQQWMKYSLMLAGIGDGSGSGDCAIMNALVNVMGAELRNAHVSRQVENLKQTETIAKRNALDDIETSLCRCTCERLLVCGRLTMVAGSRGMRLGSSDSEEAVLSGVSEMLFDEDKHTRRRAIRIIGDLAPKGDSRVIKMLTSSIDVCGTCAVKPLTDTGQVGLNDEDEIARASAASILAFVAEKGDKDVIDALLSAMKDNSLEVKLECVRSLQLKETAESSTACYRLSGTRNANRGAFDMRIDETARELDYIAVPALEVLSQMGTARHATLESLVLFRAVKTLESVAFPSASRVLVQDKKRWDDVNSALLECLKNNEGDELVWHTCFTALVRLLGLLDTEEGVDESALEGLSYAQQVLMPYLQAWLETRGSEHALQ
ncbi:hypothetical protein GUITHDRAFT_164468 [Guillardia theta CCMP2712]|uniref:Uncharacterized protein n=1 Tax=Guillardia theta (strain CCMP2712) TaxID=905079 RepID=L1IZ25_GUITC|nr:hypothetical protein GUITHDRAFT_164468 [Guillardia theta CCMP2712]EKX41085.1 hypothetical protein GUITHDRAFT_164468 [Guillardia theta CCMP2712]|eukprot:XP_005828065.1 hypothetical protein GUITHDRAFT_164468 [Guillardia theta CCMP2712]